MARKPLTRERVVGTALRLADEQGVASLTMRKLAARLDVEAMSLYHHVANKDEILDHMVDAVFGEIELPQAGDGWKPAMRQRAISARAVLVRHRWAVALMDTRTSPGEATLRHHDAVVGCLRRGGFSIALAAHAYSVLDSYLYGFVLQELTVPLGSPEETEQTAETILSQLPTERFPYFTEMIVEHALKPGYSFANEFEFGLDLILDGLERTLRRSPEE